MRNFFIAFLNDLGNFEPYLFFRTFYFHTFDFYTLQSAIVKQRYYNKKVSDEMSLRGNRGMLHQMLSDGDDDPSDS